MLSSFTVSFLGRLGSVSCPDLPPPSTPPPANEHIHKNCQHCGSLGHNRDACHWKGAPTSPAPQAAVKVALLLGLSRLCRYVCMWIWKTIRKRLPKIHVSGIMMHEAFSMLTRLHRPSDSNCVHFPRKWLSFFLVSVSTTEERMKIDVSFGDLILSGIFGCLATSCIFCAPKILFCRVISSRSPNRVWRGSVFALLFQGGWKDWELPQLQEQLQEFYKPILLGKVRIDWTPLNEIDWAYLAPCWLIFCWQSNNNM